MRMHWWYRDSNRQIAMIPVVLLGSVLQVPGGVTMKLLAAWNLGAIVYLLLVWLTFRERSSVQLRTLARLSERRRWFDRLVASKPQQIPQVAAAFALIAAAVALPRIEEQGVPVWLAFAQCGLAIVTSWMMLQAGYLLAYLGIYAKEGGLSFPGTPQPLAVDFAYFACAVGTTFATTDVEVTSSRLRRHVLLHGILAFVFNSLIVAILVGVVTTHLSS
ncbi:DUF1345 domain-containing protein [Nakamurella sp. YIM 132087]|uniref:DUF1345 domain-containing protein n=1 Tax=Nakamurella alba TaxID=2665158 RepID=A0A7K1FKV5_9ACTN|nr:DUF1345 domain-containing protein [Nakamurella alba]MTD14787.1 DUF1345 domain-containing protein [Nakamurella alba]